MTVSQRSSYAKRVVPIAAVICTLATGSASAASMDHPHPSLSRLIGRAVLPVETYAPGPPSGTLLPPGVVNGITFPLPSQPVQGFSGIIDGRRPGEYLAMPDNGFGAKATSRDFLIRAYYITPDFKTAHGGTGDVAVGDFISFSDPDNLIGFPIVMDGTADRLLTGGDIDPESLQRDHRGDLWVGDEFGPWILHFDASGKLLDPPFAIPGIMSPNNPFLAGQPATHPNSRGFEALAISPNGKYLYAALEGATIADPDQSRRLIFEFDIRRKALTDRVLTYHTAVPTNSIADMTALDNRRLLLIERDGGLGVTALFRNLSVINIHKPAADGAVDQSVVLDLTSIPDPDGVSLPAIHPGDLGLGDPFWVMCESVEAVHVINHERILVGCDNNFPNKGRNPNLADDNEFIVVRVQGL